MLPVQAWHPIIMPAGPIVPFAIKQPIITITAAQNANGIDSQIVIFPHPKSFTLRENLNACPIGQT